MPASPEANSEGVLRIVVSCDGTPIQETLPPVSITIHRALNAIPWAQLTFLDGDMPTGAFPASDQTSLVPGTVVKVSAGYGDEETPLFEGLVVRHGISIDQENTSRLVVECRDKALDMTLGRHCANYIDKTDSAIMKELIGQYGLSAAIQDTSITHSELVQFHCSDWDFMMARAEFNGLVVSVVDGKVSAKAPDTSTAPELAVTWGADLVSFEADMDARCQMPSIQAAAWDPKTQAVLKSGDVKPSPLNDQGNITGTTLASALSQKPAALLTSAPQTREVLKQWAGATQLKAGLARIQGRMAFQGSAKAKVGSMIKVAGVGQRFSGNVYVTSVQHELVDGNWLTTATFGMEPTWHMERPDVAAPPASGLLPPVSGLQTGVVMKLDGDPLGESRIQVKVPVLEATTEGVWARLLQPHASNSFGFFFVPEVGDEVVLGYFNDDPCHPVVIGSLYSSKLPPPSALEASNDTKTIVTRCKHKITFDEKNKIITLTTPGNNQIVLDDTDKSILAKDQNGNSVKLSSSGIVLDSPYDIQLTAKGGIKLDATTAISITSKADVGVKGLNVNCEAQVGLNAKGTATAELSASGQTTVKGAMVMIN